MTSNSKRAIAFCVGIGFALAVTNAADPWQVVTVNRLALEGTLKDGTEFELRVESQEPKEQSIVYVGATGTPRAVISDFALKLGGKKVSVPDAAFNDLANPLLQTVSITSQPGAVKLRFTGGEGEASYEVEYLVQSGRLAQRTLSYFEAGANGEKGRIVKTATF
ncbi:MAG: hypothetical protein ABR514_07880 [Chthoniobacterales bacterium]